MLIRSRRCAMASLVIACVLSMTGCKERPRTSPGGETIALSQVPAPVKATIDQQARGRAISEVEKRATKGTTQYAVTLGTGDQKQELILDEAGNVVATNDSEEDDD